MRAGPNLGRAARMNATRSGHSADIEDGTMIQNNIPKMHRRQLLQGAGAVSLATISFNRFAFAAPRKIRIGVVAPQTGPLAIFSEQIPWTLEQMMKVNGGQIDINGTKHPLEIVLRDSQSNPNRAAEVAKNLILQEKVDVVTAFATPETVNPVADQCELAGIPCLSNDAPLEPYFFGRGGDPKKGFDWTYHFFFSATNLADSYFASWDQVSTNKVIGALWPNDNDGQAFSKIFSAVAQAKGYKVVDPGRFDLPAGNYAAQIAAFKAGGVEIVSGVIPPPEYTAFASAAAQQNFRPKVVSVSKANEFPAAVAPLGERALGLSVEVWWSPTHPYKSGLTGQSSQELADAYEAATGRQWSMTLGFRHSLFEVAIDALKRTQNLDDAASIRDAIAATEYDSIVGPINFKSGPFPNTCRTPLVIGQWQKGKKYPVDLINVDNTTAQDIPVGGKLTPVV
jgi:branched-chain amino acid transport system substrate-binding protein